MKTLLLALLIPLAGCQAAMYGTAADLNKLANGMSKAQVIQTLGNPSTTSANLEKHEETLNYIKMAQVITMWPSNYAVVLHDNKVISYGLAP